MRSFFTEPENIFEKEIVLTEDAQHIKNVLRMNEGDEILVFDGTGTEYKAVIDRIEQHRVVCKRCGDSFCAAEPKLRVTLFQGIPKSDKMEQIIQKSTELGVFEIVPVEMSRCVAKVQKTSDKLKRWNKISREAAKQSGRGIVPLVCEPISFSQAVEKATKFDFALMPYEALGHLGERGLKQVLEKNRGKKNLAVLIGPEGGFSDSEARLAAEANIEAVGLGKRILRTETAGSAVLSVVMYEYDEM